MRTTNSVLRLVVPLCAGLATTLVATRVWAFKYCVRAQMDISNNLPPPAEDWPGYDVTHWRMDGVRMKVEKLVSGSWTAVTSWEYSDGNACVDVPASPPNGIGTYRAKLQSRGRPVNNWYVNVTTSDDPNELNYYTDSSGHYISEISVQDTHTFDINYSSDLLRIYTVIANVAHERFNGGLSGTSVHVQLDDGGAGPFVCGNTGPQTCSNGTKVQITTNLANSKQLIAHEWGHVVHARAKAERGGDGWPSNYSYFSANTSCRYGDDGTNDKGLRSQEWAGAAAGEGFADFVAIDAWNIHETSDTNPVAYWWDSFPDPWRLVDMEHGQYYYVTAYCDEHCDRIVNDPYCTPGTGTILDWSRQFWDVHTNNYSGMTGDWQSHSDMLDLARVGWGTTDAYERIEAGLSGTDDDRWRANAAVNGIVHP